ncbi:hypothetical protein [Leifsonia aquatica]|uniref:hypothetical protein n=1 Tax=Leifsonia aquatica TaxID=144185 RepID=UPI00046B03A8|nr:hypothetical protein [Leifsonia aquatica]
MVRRIVRAYGRRFEDEGDEPELAELFGLLGDVEDALQLTVDQLRDRDVSWAAIGRAVGMTGEGARKRWDRDRKSRAA